MKAIINGKLYDTVAAKLIAQGPFLRVFCTEKGNWFEQIYSVLEEGYEIHAITVNEAKSLVGFHAPDSYEKYFGQPEEA